MPGTHLSPPACLPNSSKLVPEPAQLKAASPHGLELGGCGWDGPIAWGWYLKLRPGTGSAGPQHRAGTVPYAPCPGSCLGLEQMWGWRQPWGAQQHPDLQH